MPDRYTEEALINGIKETSDPILNYIYISNYPKAIKMAKGMSDKPIDVKDIFHEALITMIENIRHGKFKNQSKVETYLLGIFKFKTFESLRKKGQEHILIENTDFEDIHEYEDVDQEKLKKAMLCLSKISEQCKKLLLAFYYENKNMKELSSEFNYSEAFVRVKKNRCMNKLKTIINQSNGKV